MTRNVSDAAKAAVELRDGVLFLRWVRGAVIEEKDALAAMGAVSRLCQGRGHPMLVDMAATAWLSCKARKVFARRCLVTRVALLGSSPVDWAIATFFLGRCSPPWPARFFTSRAEAMTWLASSAPGMTVPGTE
ncbi:DUF7793 family protein [Arthrobacter humicola]